MGAEAVMALGAAAGGAAGGALKGNTSTYGPDTSVPGVASATIKKGGKGTPDVNVPQADIKQSLQWLDQAASTQESYYLQGLDYYTQALTAASKTMEAGYNKANATLTPLSAASNAALNEQLKMMGMAPISPVKGFSSLVSPYSADLAKQIDAADAITDPAQRAQAKADINAKFSQLQSAVPALRNDADKPSLYTAKSYESSVGPLANSYKNSSQFAKDKAQWDAQEQGKVAASKMALDTWEKSGVTQPEINATNTKNLELTNLASDFNSKYTDEAGKGYTGDEVTAKIESTPGYGFQFNQGTKAVERQGAAAGMLGSGNTLTALTTFGQGLAQNYYGQYMSNLSNIVAEGSGATQQIASNQAAVGTNNANYLALGGSAYQAAYGAIGDAKANALTNKANLYASTAQFNASMQDQNINAALNRQTQLQNTALSSATGFQQNALNQAKFNYGVAQNQQAGSQYFGSQGVSV